jgi:hypothetical protein
MKHALSYFPFAVMVGGLLVMIVGLVWITNRMFLGKF